MRNTTDFWANLDRDIRRTSKMISWLINGQFIHGLSPMVGGGKITPEWIEERYNVDFGD